MSRKHWEGLVLGSVVLAAILIIALAVARAWPQTFFPAELTIVERVDAEAQYSMASAAWMMVVVSVLSIGTGIAGLYFIVENLRAARALQADTAASARAAERAAEAAAYGNIVARDMGMAQTRAYLAVTDVVAELAGANNFTLTVHVANSGTTPAINLRMDICLGITAPPEPDGSAETQIMNGPIFAPSLPAGTPTEITASWPLDSENTSLLAYGQPVIEASGTVQYTDVFGTRHVDYFAYRSPARSFPFEIGIGLNRLPDPSSSPDPVS